MLNKTELESVQNTFIFALEKQRKKMQEENKRKKEKSNAENLLKEL